MSTVPEFGGDAHLHAGSRTPGWAKTSTSTRPAWSAAALRWVRPRASGKSQAHPPRFERGLAWSVTCSPWTRPRPALRGARPYFAAFPTSRLACSVVGKNPSPAIRLMSSCPGRRSGPRWPARFCPLQNRRRPRGRTDPPPASRPSVASAIRVQFFVGGVHRFDARAVQIGDKAVVKSTQHHDCDSGCSGS